jgi:hypothetical protein
LGHFPIMPFSAQLAVDIPLHFGHLPVVPSGQCRAMSWQLGHFPRVFFGHFGVVTLTQSGHLPAVPFGQERGVMWGMIASGMVTESPDPPPPHDRGGPAWPLCPPHVWSRFPADPATAEDTAKRPMSKVQTKRIATSPLGQDGRHNPRL